MEYLKHDVPSVDTVVEEDKLQKKLALAQSQRNWKLEAQALMQLGQLMKWKGLMDQGDAFLEQSATILRDHTFEDEETQVEADQ
uniref:PIK-related kinase FAT domain-containing protein n=1 Tax=Globisporangium ultimum (strain ATCC 200006 / CBS 805.95 / DAOM BR144) TaxID=431595 RepID=K3WTK3_GLOUD